jgi:hypothetical protein
MKRLTPGLVVALLTFIVGIAAASAWSVLRRSPAKSNKLLSGARCRHGLVSVEPQLNVPLRISISEAVCDNPQGASVHFVVENVSSKPISKYDIRRVVTYEGLIDDKSGVTTEGTILQPHQTKIGFIGGGVITGAGGVPVGEDNMDALLTSIEIACVVGFQQPSR